MNYLRFGLQYRTFRVSPGWTSGSGGSVWPRERERFSKLNERSTPRHTGLDKRNGPYKKEDQRCTDGWKHRYSRGVSFIISPTDGQGVFGYEGEGVPPQ